MTDKTGRPWHAAQIHSALGAQLQELRSAPAPGVSSSRLPRCPGSLKVRTGTRRSEYSDEPLRTTEGHSSGHSSTAGPHHGSCGFLLPSPVVSPFLLQVLVQSCSSASEIIIKLLWACESPSFCPCAYGQRISRALPNCGLGTSECWEGALVGEPPALRAALRKERGSWRTAGRRAGVSAELCPVR